MSNKDSSLSKEQQKLLKQFKKQISNPHSSKIANQPESKKSQAESEELEDTHLFKQAVAGVKPINNSNIADVKTPRAKKLMHKLWRNVQLPKVVVIPNMPSYQIHKLL